MARTIGIVCGNLLYSCSFAKTRTGKMSRRQSGSYTKSGSGGSSWGSSWQERRQKRHEDREYEQGEEQSGLGMRLFQTHRTVSGASRHERFDKRDEELKRLRSLVRDLELEARGRHRRRDRKERAEGSASVGGGYGEASHQAGSHRHWDWSREYVDKDSISPKGRWPWNAATDAMSRALRVNFVYQLLHTGSVLVIGTEKILNRSRRLLKGIYSGFLSGESSGTPIA
ncbi:hypothetical protein SO802_031609 [Lithocarpus litseifolius]|uniref:Uncharacterized protein n=1 Tax=Lithocarpus litseifolius TaxID=425828 RepID=A0AAW2BMQ6_9ROSI